MISFAAAVFTAPGQPLEIRSFPLPEPRLGERLVEVLCCNLCGSDLHTLSGRRAEPAPSILGHEIVGLLEGRRVTWPMVLGCGHCLHCANGNPVYCARRHKFGHATLTNPPDPSGGFATHCLLPPETPVMAIPDVIPTTLAASLNCAFATAHAMRAAAGEIRGKTVVVLGLGMLGLIVGAMCHHAGASSVWGVEAHAGRLNAASAFGILPAGEAPVDIVFDATGHAGLVRAWIERLNPAGCAILAGAVFPAGELSLDLESVVRRSLRLRGVYNYSTGDLAGAITFLADSIDQYPFATLVAPPFALPRINEAIELARSGRFHRVAVYPGVQP
jgi:threonine 3-dehydrogenase